jgi:hypothetical protein
MRLFDRVPSRSLESSEMHLILLAAAAIIVLAAGLPLFMYSVASSQTALAPGRTMSAACIGFCVLSVLLALYLVDPQTTNRRLRQQIGEDRSWASEALKRASADPLETRANFSSYQDQLMMEYRRAATGTRICRFYSSQREYATPSLRQASVRQAVVMPQWRSLGNCASRSPIP